MTEDDLKGKNAVFDTPMGFVERAAVAGIERYRQRREGNRARLPDFPEQLLTF